MLVIPGGFLPYNDTVTLLTYKRLRDLDYDFDVIAFKGPKDLGIAKELEKDENFKKFNIEYLCNYDDAIAIKKPYKLPLSIINMARYIKLGLAKVKENEYDCIYTSSVPGISHIVGYKIKKKYPKIKWVASFSDPIKNSPYKKDPNLKLKNILYRIAFKVGSDIYMNDKYEEVAINNADKLIFICEEQRDFTLSQYPNGTEFINKSEIMPLTYIPEWNIYKNLIEPEKTNNNPKQAVHLGRLYGLRKIDNFLIALKELKEENEELSSKIVFHQYSEIQSYDVEKIKQFNLQDVFILHDKVNYEESTEIMKKADILVLFDTIMHGAKIQPYLPSKITEYMLLKKPILGICENNSPSFRILKENGYELNGYEVDTIKENIKKII